MKAFLSRLQMVRWPRGHWSPDRGTPSDPGNDAHAGHAGRIRVHTDRLSTRRSRVVVAMLLLISLSVVQSPAGTSAVLSFSGTPELPKIRIDAEHRGFRSSEGRPYVPFGINYYRPGTGWAPQVWKQFDPEVTRIDFQRMKALGVNCVRVFLTFGSFLQSADRVEPSGLAKWDEFVALARESELYVHPTGPDHWEGLPVWARGDRYADEQVLLALENFWRQFAAHNRGRGTVFAYDLLNEPEVRWNTPAMRAKWIAWAQSRYGTAEAAAQAWGLGADSLGWPNPDIPAPQDAPGDARLLDFQRFREEIADAWTRRQVQAIRAADPDALVTVGLIQWSVPALLAHPQHYSGFRPERQARLLDFLEIHFYPLEQGFYAYSSAAEESANLAYAEAVVRAVAMTGKPVVVGEFGWYGGGLLRLPKATPPLASEADQARWCRRFVEVTAPWACGWLNWGFYDQPEAGDVSQLTGLMTSDGRLKRWGSEFRELARERGCRPSSELPEVRRPELDWDRCLTSAAAGQAYRRAYLEAFREQHGLSAR
jgi:hypothetical protein